MSKQWIKEQVKHNELQDWVQGGIIWVQANRQAALGTGGGVLGALLLGLFLIYRHNAAQAEAWDHFSLAQIYAYNGRLDLSMGQVQELSGSYSGAKATGFAMMFGGDILFRQGSYKEAADAYAKVLERGSPILDPVALSNMALAQESAGLYPQAAATAQRFLDSHSDHFLAPLVSACLARSLEISGQADQAKAALQRITLQYPETSWASWAQARLSGQ